MPTRILRVSSRRAMRRPASCTACSPRRRRRRRRQVRPDAANDRIGGAARGARRSRWISRSRCALDGARDRRASPPTKNGCVRWLRWRRSWRLVPHGCRPPTKESSRPTRRRRRLSAAAEPAPAEGGGSPPSSPGTSRQVRAGCAVPRHAVERGAERSWERRAEQRLAERRRRRRRRRCGRGTAARVDRRLRGGGACARHSRSRRRPRTQANASGDPLQRRRAPTPAALSAGARGGRERRIAAGGPRRADSTSRRARASPRGPRGRRPRSSARRRACESTFAAARGTARVRAVFQTPPTAERRRPAASSALSRRRRPGGRNGSGEASRGGAPGARARAVIVPVYSRLSAAAARMAPAGDGSVAGALGVGLAPTIARTTAGRIGVVMLALGRRP